ncbi:AMP-binding protein [Tamlana sedimentorum]|uniref:AMP-binding protein n=1 Tax=Neotamlana sedimentorum TaxID=1435349 RepID=A0A0D7WGC2_9FLAO|nr:phenylacetate--CoA ligase family protein [Tamlana sedimentorum]KJD36772.1 AMP-binding protein [Tamlana sedimentorum]
MNVFDFSLKLNGFPIAKAKRVLKDIQSKNEVDFIAFAEEKKRDIIMYHLNHNPFYKSFGKNIDLNNWNSVPVMTKSDLQQPLEQRLSEGFTTKNIYVNKTSGSSGHPFIFAKDKFCHALTWAVIQNRFGWYNINFNSSKQARFYGIPLNKVGYYKERFKDFLSHRYRFSVFNLSDEAFAATLQKFKTTTFHYINGYTSAIVQFAKYLEKKNIVLKSVCPSLNVCVVTSEMLFETDKKLLETQLGIPVVNEYGASELDLIAFQNPNGNWQLNSETLFIEILDEKNKVLPNGEEGRVVITSLYNKAQPFIRYDLGDIGVLSKKSTIKTPILEKLTGRTNDIVILPSGKRAAGLTFYYITKSIIENDGKVKEFVIEQVKPDTFKIIYVGDETLSESQKQTINRKIEHYLESGLHIIYEKQNKLNRQKSGKLKQFSSYLNKKK